MMPRGVGHFASQAVIPEQVPAYVEAVSDSRAVVCGTCIAYESGTDVTLIGYPLHDPLDAGAVDEAVDQARRLPVLVKGGHLTVLCAARPHAAPARATFAEDNWWGLDLPLAPLPSRARHKMNHMLRRAEQAVSIEQSQGKFDAAHQQLVDAQIRRRPLAPGTRFIYSRLPQYLAASPQAVLFSAYSRETGELTACAVGEYASLHTAFYLFAFRAPDAPFGAADLLLSALLREAEARGHTRCNLGLGINSGISFFKRKWQAKIVLPYQEYSWTPQTKAWWKFWA
ncbi:MAG: GNAT family N-acetyltransferase [Desulfovibrionaceae bacterium]|nr:GNAT family N-acetyltransferase [Desulfovibrionaceae bacterium]